MKTDYRHTKIIFTIGPASESEEMLEQLIREGGNICRLNMAHADHQWTRKTIQRLRAASARVGRDIAIMMDIKGPEIRTGDLPETIHLVKGELFDFITAGSRAEKLETNIRGVTVNYPSLAADVSVGATLLVDSGLVRMEVVELLDDRVRCRVEIPGPMGSRRHINLPGVKVNLPALTEKDKADIAIGIEGDVEFFALSFVRQASDLELLRSFLEERDCSANIVAKIEDQSAITNMNAIISACDGLMVARGDLGIECPYEELPLIQRSAVNQCIRQKKPVIVATHMLESMIQSPIPTRAEVTDVANAVFETADCLMLSGETAVGKYPLECIQVLDRISKENEGKTGLSYRQDIDLKTPKAKMLRSAVVLAQDLNAGIVVFTRRGYLAQILSSLRPSKVPIYAFTDIPLIYKQMQMLWGVEPFFIEFSADHEATIEASFEQLKTAQHGWTNPGDWMVVITNVLTEGLIVDTIQMRKIE